MRRLLLTILFLLALVATACTSGGETAGDGTAAPLPSSPSATSPSTPSPSASDATSPATPTTPDTPTPPSEPTADEEVRAVWVHLFDDTLKSRVSVDAMLDRVAEAGFNTVVAEVVRRQDAYYDSQILPRTTDPDLEADLDLVAYGVEAAHQRGLQFHAWVPTMPAYHGVYEDLPVPPGWVWTEHGPDAPEAQRWVTRTADGAWDDHLDPGVPAVREHVAAVAREIVANYDVDGIHLDYVRYPRQGTGYNPIALDRFRADTGATGTPAVDDPAWAAWKRDQVDALVAGVRRAVGEAASGTPVTAAVIAQGEGPHDGFAFEQTRGYTDYHQDWPSWLRDGLLDAAFPMTYFNASEHGVWFDQWAAFQAGVAAEVEPLVVGGMAGYLNPIADGVEQIQRLREGTDGVALYSYQQTTDTEPYDALLAELPARVWPDRAPVPDWPG